MKAPYVSTRSNSEVCIAVSEASIATAQRAARGPTPKTTRTQKLISASCALWWSGVLALQRKDTGSYHIFEAEGLKTQKVPVNIEH